MTTTTSIHVRIPSALKELAQKAADDDRRTFSDIVRFSLEQYLQDHGYSIDQL